MPRKYKKKQVTRRRPYRKRKPMRRYLPIGGFENKKLVKLRYVEQFTLDPSSTVSVSQVFRANSLFDPNYTGVGHQPSNFDRLASLYDRYTVLGAKIKVQWVPTTSNTINPPPVLGVHLSEAGDDMYDAYIQGGIQSVLEQPRLAASAYYVGAPFLEQKPLIKTFSAKKFFGTKNIVGVDPYSADVTANPEEGAFFEVIAMSPDGSADPAVITLRATIEYIALMTEPKLADTS